MVRTRAARFTRCAVASALVTALFLALAGAAQAARVLVFTASGHVTVRSDPFLPAQQSGTAAIPQQGAATIARRSRPQRRAAAAPRSGTGLRATKADTVEGTVPQVLSGLLAQGQISSADYTTDLRIWNKGVAALPTLSGTPAVELGAVMSTAVSFAANGVLTASRAPEVFMTLWRNRQWWTGGTIPTSGQRIEFSGSQIVWEYYPGQGIQLQVLGTFGKADGLYTSGPADYSQMLSLVNEMIPLAAIRNGALAWEYLFSFENGSPPWTSAMSQGTAIEALTRAAAASTAQGDASDAAHYLSVAHQALAILQQPPPEGVAVATALGTRFVLYSFNPGEAVINGFLQTLIGLYDYAQASGDSEAQALFDAGNAEAQAEVPSYDTGAWSLYEPGQEDTLDYHQLVTGFLQQLCERTSAPVYCTTAQHFESYLTTPPVLGLLSTSAPSGSVTIPFSLSKISQVSVNVSAGSQTIYSTSSQFSYGDNSVTVPSLSPGTYTVGLTATDLAGNAGQTAGTLTVVSPTPPSPPPSSGAPPSGVPSPGVPSPGVPGDAGSTAGPGLTSGSGSTPAVSPHQTTPEVDVTGVVQHRLSRGRLQFETHVTSSAPGGFSVSLTPASGSGRSWVIAHTGVMLRRAPGSATVSFILSRSQVATLQRRKVRRLELVVAGPQGGRHVAVFAARLG